MQRKAYQQDTVFEVGISGKYFRHKAHIYLLKPNELSGLCHEKKILSQFFGNSFIYTGCDNGIDLSLLHRKVVKGGGG